jgi:hypothetical protein
VLYVSSVKKKQSRDGRKRVAGRVAKKSFFFPADAEIALYNRSK